MTTEREVRYRLAPRDSGFARWWALAGVLLLLGLWEWSVRQGWISPVYLPAPSQIASALAALVQNGTLGPALAASVLRWLVGVIAGGLAALLLALAGELSLTFRRLIEPYIYFFYPLPKIAILPLFVLWLGIGELPKYVLIALGVFFPVFINTMAGLVRLPRLYREVAAMYPVSRGRYLRTVALPAVLPELFAGLQLGCGTALVLVVAAEMIAAQTGIGALILHFGDLMLTAPLLACIFVLCVAGLIVQALLAQWQRYMTPWRDHR